MVAQPQTQTPLNRLEAMVNGVLIQTGKVFKGPKSPSSSDLFHTTSEIHQAIPKATGTFHSALDELETQLLEASAILTRDLNVVRARRAEEERKAAAAAAATKNMTATHPTQPGARDNGVSNAINAQDMGFKSSDGDVLLAERNGDKPITTPAAQGGSNVVNKDSTNPRRDENAKTGLTETSTGKPQLGVTTTGVGGSESKPGSQVDERKSSIAATADETPATAGANMADLESMFNNDFKMEFLTDENGDHNMLGTEFSHEDNHNPQLSMDPDAHIDHDDLNSLLPGLEHYANGGLDTADVPTATHGPTDAETSAMSSQLAPPDSNYDESFLDSSFVGADGSANGQLPALLDNDGELFDDLFDMVVE